MGAIPLDQPVTCPECGGKGMSDSGMRVVKRSKRGVRLVGTISRCHTCAGVGRIEAAELQQLDRQNIKNSQTDRNA